MKKVLSLLLAALMVFAMVGCTKTETPASEAPASEAPAQEPLKIGFILVGDASDMGYNYNHAAGMQEMQAALGVTDEQIVYKNNVPEGTACETAVRELVEAGCDIIFANSFGHENYMVEVAAEYPEIQFCHATGFVGASDDLANTHNYFASIYEARYLAGIAAGLKAKEIGNSKLGYVAAKPFAEVISGFTAFYLGAKSVYEDVTMDVIYTNEWSDATLEAQAAQALIDGGAGVISQHSDTTAPATTAENNGAFQVGYNADMISAAPKASLVSARVNWGVYYTYAVQCMLNGEEIAQDWCKGLSDGAVYLSPLNKDIIAEGTADTIATAEAAIKDGSLHVFAGPLTGTGTDFSGNTITLDVKEGEWFHEQEEASAPSFQYIIPGITIVE